jgi:hypothetical protein
MMHTSRVLVAALVAAWATAAGAQAPSGSPVAAPAASGAQAPRAVRAPARAPRANEVESDPIRCWWKTDRTSVRVGERFARVLTCVVIAASGLDGGAVQLTPFEVVSTTRRDDVVAPPWRYLQFEYAVRVLNDGFFGQDITIPALNVTYNIQAPGGGTQGRDQTYVLPALPMRVLSIVPKAASDIRDASSQTFGDVEARRFRAQALSIGAIAAFAFAALLALLAVTRVARSLRKTVTPTTRTLDSAELLGASVRALRALQDDVRGGWTGATARRGLSALRVAAAAALGRPVAQQESDAAAAVDDGQLSVKTGVIGRGRMLISAGVTSQSLRTALERGPVPDAGARAALGRLVEALAAMNAAAYGRQEPTDRTDLDAALSDGLDAARQLRGRARWPRRTVLSLSRSVGL